MHFFRCGSFYRIWLSAHVFSVLVGEPQGPTFESNYPDFQFTQNFAHRNAWTTRPMGQRDIRSVTAAGHTTQYTRILAGPLQPLLESHEGQ